MNESLKYYWLAGAAAVATILLAWFPGRMLGLKGTDLLLLRAGTAAIGFSMIGAYLWPRFRGAASARPTAERAAEDAAATGPATHDGIVAALVGETESNLGRKLAETPIILVIDPDRAPGASSLVENSGLEVESLSVVQGGRAWVSGATVLIEVKPDIYDNTRLWGDLIRTLKPRRVGSAFKRGAQAPRGVVLAVATSPFTRREGGTDVNQFAGTLRARLRDISRPLGMAIPVYVVFTGMQELQHFESFASRLSEDMAWEPFGVTFEIRHESGVTVWADQQTKRITVGFAELFEILSGCRLEVLQQEQHQQRRSSAYLFPREFKKLTRLGPISDFLLEVSRPHQLGASAYVRGFYFTGLDKTRTRPLGAAKGAAAQRPVDNLNFTSVLIAIPDGPVTNPEPQPPQQSRTEWIFARRLFTDVVLPDIENLRHTFVSSNVNLARRIALGALTAVLAFLVIGATVSYISNRRLEDRAAEYGRSLPTALAFSDQRISTDQLEALDTMRRLAIELRRNDPPLHLRFGLYRGNQLYPEVRRAYLDRFSRLMLSPVQQDLRVYLASLGSTASSSEIFDPAYAALKAYVITRLHPEKSTRDFLSPVLHKWWSKPSDDSHRLDLARDQFDFFSEELRSESPATAVPDDATVKARRFLQDNFGDMRSVYGFMTGNAARGLPAIRFAAEHPQDIVVGTPDIPAAFTKAGWTRMQALLRHPGSLADTDPWVVELRPVASNIVTDLNAHYIQDYGDRWSAFLHDTRVVACGRTPNDSARRITGLSGAQSPLLALFCVAAENTDLESAELSGAFQSVRKVVPKNCGTQLSGESNKGYLAALFDVKEQLQAPLPPGSDRQTMIAPQLTAARRVARAMQAEQADARWKINSEVERLLNEPINAVEKCTPGVDIGGACAELATLKKKYPFDPRSTVDASIAEVDAYYNPKTGTLWAYQQQALGNLVVERGGQFYPNPAAAPRSVRDEVLKFLTRSARVRDTLYKSGSGPELAIPVKVSMSPGITSVRVRIGHTVNTYAAGQTEAKEFKWTRQDTGAELQVDGAGGVTFASRSLNGPWAWVRLIDEMKVVRQSGAGTSLQWEIRDSRSNEPARYNGQPLRIELEVLGEAAQMFTSGIRSQYSCVSRVTQ